MTTREEAGRSNETFRSAILFSEDPGYLNDTLLQVGVCQLVVVVEEEEEEEELMGSSTYRTEMAMPFIAVLSFSSKGG